MSGFVYVCVGVEGMSTCYTGKFGNERLCLCLCCSRGYVIGSLLVSVVGLLLGFNEGIELLFLDGNFLNRTVGALVEL